MLPRTQLAAKLFTRHAISSQRRAIASFTLPDLPYDYNALSPVISGEIMELHHSKHHQTYVNMYNQALEQYHEAEQRQDNERMIALQPQLRFNGGGHINHSIFWTNLIPPQNQKSDQPTGNLMRAIEKEFGSFQSFQQTLNAKTVAIQGSGWGWLGYCKSTKRLSIATLSNQDPLSTVGLVPLLGIDAWEHAYYLQYKNVRAEYLKEIWKIVNWENVSERFENAQK